MDEPLGFMVLILVLGPFLCPYIKQNKNYACFDFDKKKAQKDHNFYSWCSLWLLQFWSTLWFIPIILFCSLKFELEIQIFNELYIVLLLDILPWWTQLGTLGHPGWLEFRDFTKFLWNHIIRTMAAAWRTSSAWRRRHRRCWAVSRNSRSAPTAAVRWRHYRGGISFLWLYIFRESYPSTKRW